jgi:hypothetical protein
LLSARLDWIRSFPPGRLKNWQLYSKAVAPMSPFHGTGVDELGEDDIQAAKHWRARANIRRKVAA